MAGKQIQVPTYSQYVASLRPFLSAKSENEWPKIIVITGGSVYLQQRTCQALISVWNKFKLGDAQSVEASELGHGDFRSMWSQVSLFEPRSLYIVRRANQCRGIASWFAEIKSPDSLKSNFVFEFSDKLPAEISRQLTRLGGVVIHCEEPTTTHEFEKVVDAFCRRRNLALDTQAVKLVVDSMGHDLSRLENQIEALSLQFWGAEKVLTRADIASSIGSLREDDVFELFEALRRNKLANAHLMCENFIDRGESAIALTGIFSRFARDLIERGNAKKGVNVIKSCAVADRRLKSSKIDESMIMSSIIESFLEV